MVLAPYLPYGGGQVWGADFLPGVHQGTRIVPGQGDPIPNMKRRAESASLQELELSWLADFNRKHQKGRESDPSLAARIKSMETAYGMQQEAPEVFDLSKETDATHALYGLERGVRFIELIDAGADINKNWDAHFDLQIHRTLARNVDQPIAGLLRDLKSRGMLEDTLVVWTTELGRTPFLEKADGKGREHHRHGAFPRLPRDHSPLARHGPHQAHLSIRGPGFPADRRRGKCRKRGLRIAR